MLQSMVESPMPTRAEVSDVANAIIDYADAVMLSAETATGAYPAAAVEMMRRVAATTESYLHEANLAPPPPPVSPKARTAAAVADAAVHAARDLGARLIAAWTRSGATVRLLAGHRLPIPIVALTGDERVRRRLNLVHGVVPVHVEPLANPAAMVNVVEQQLIEKGLTAADDLIVLVSSIHPHVRGATDTVLIHRVGMGGA
jgi:pyruvate kinase